MQPWPAPVERVAAFLRATQVDARLEEFPTGTPTASAAAEAVGCALAQIVKSLLFATADGRYIVAFVPGDRRADLQKVAEAAAASRVRMASAEEVRHATGFDPGAVAPFPPARAERTLIERTLLAHELVWAGAGSEHHMVGLAPSDLIRLTRALQADLVE